jgi:hypothetical protein
MPIASYWLALDYDALEHSLEVVGYGDTGQVTRDSRTKPFQLVREAMNTNSRTGARIQDERCSSILTSTPYRRKLVGSNFSPLAAPNELSAGARVYRHHVRRLRLLPGLRCRSSLQGQIDAARPRPRASGASSISCN